MANSKEQRSLRNILIIPGFQGRMVCFMILVGVVCGGLNAYLFYSYVVDSYGFILKYSSLSRELIEGRYRDLYVFGMSLGGGMLLIVLMIAVWGLFMTHRAAGSIYHMRKVIEEIKAGNLSARVHLRPKDEFQDLAQSFNQMMDELQKARV